jgi:hypothetical protein
MAATSEQKFALVFEARERASGKIKALRKELNALGGTQMVKSQNEIKKLTRQVGQLTNAGSKGAKVFTKFTNGIAIGNLAASVFEKTISKLAGGFKWLVSEIGEATMVAANVEELGSVLNFVGQKAGYSTEQIDGYVASLRESGIAQKETNQALLRSAQAQISFADAVKLGKIAQDAATIGQTDSSEAFQRLIDATAKLMPRQLKELGIVLNLNQVYKKYSRGLGVTSTSLTEAQKKQAMLNAIFEKGDLIAGAYEMAMQHVSKLLRSFPRYIQDLQVAVGSYLTPSLAVLVTEAKNVTKGLTAAFEGDSAEAAQTLAADIAVLTSGLVLGTKVLHNLGQISTRVWKVSFIDPIDSVITAAEALYTALSNPTDLNAWAMAGHKLDTVFDGFKTSWEDTEKDLADIDTAVLQHAQNIAAAYASIGHEPDDVDSGGGDDDAESDIADTISKANRAQQKTFDHWAAFDKSLKRQRIESAKTRAGELAEVELTAFEASILNLTDREQRYQRDRRQLNQEYQESVVAMNDTLQLTDEERRIALKDMHAVHLSELEDLDRNYATTKEQIWAETYERMIWPAQTFTASLQTATQGAVTNAIGTLTVMETESRGIFKNMATDFINLFINAILKSVALKLVGNLAGGGILGMLSSLFDTTANDRMAADQGRDFMRHFTRGVTEEAAGGGELAVGMSRVSAPAPTHGGNGGMVVVNVTVSGNVLSDEYIEREIGPKLQKLVGDGRSLLAVSERNATGGLDVDVD